MWLLFGAIVAAAALITFLAALLSGRAAPLSSEQEALQEEVQAALDRDFDSESRMGMRGEFAVTFVDLPGDRRARVHLNVQRLRKAGGRYCYGGSYTVVNGAAPSPARLCVPVDAVQHATP